ncbi:MAG TPA: GntG family PLP-dependent aldolase [Candidatus Nanopelagicales bacterium]|nr:GntG family PLP-dependent aldolase [Candidatus Nanopelagicales bacterium]
MLRIDLRSDTVTHPTPAMRRAMAAAEVGDDVLGDDPTVNALEARAAELLGKEAAVFVASGTMGNLVAQLAHLARGEEIIAAATSHLVMDEAAGHAVVVGASVRSLPENADGTIDPAAIEAAFRDPDDPHEPTTGLISLENTHAHSMARPLSIAYEEAVAAIAHRNGIPLHLDGARFFNAVVAVGVAPAALAAPADSVTFCLSKGLACPVGSVVVGTRDVVRRARRARKLLGGGMRQAGVLAAAGLVALSDGPDGTISRLADDHANARALAEGLADLEGVESPGGIAQPAPGRLDPGRAVTDFVIFRVARDRAAFLGALEARGVLMTTYPHDTVRAVTHYGVERADVDATIAAVRAALAATAGTRPAAGAAAAAATGAWTKPAPVGAAHT